MPNTRLPNSIFFVLVLVAAMQSAYYAPRIPEILGAHFGKSGIASAWQMRVEFFAPELNVIGVAALVAFGLPRLIAAVPASPSAATTMPISSVVKNATLVCQALAMPLLANESGVLHHRA